MEIFHEDFDAKVEEITQNALKGIPAQYLSQIKFGGHADQQKNDNGVKTPTIESEKIAPASLEEISFNLKIQDIVPCKCSQMPSARFQSFRGMEQEGIAIIKCEACQNTSLSWWRGATEAVEEAKERWRMQNEKILKVGDE